MFHQLFSCSNVFNNLRKSHHLHSISIFFFYPIAERLASYGFRGEALSAICAVAQVTIVTRSKDHELAMAYTYDSNGKVSESRMAHRGKGMTKFIVD